MIQLIVQKMKSTIYALLIALFSVGYSYTFTSNEGTEFDGDLLQVESDTVTISRASDKKEFTLNKSRFSREDQKYFEEWAAKNPHLNMPGRNVAQISLRATTARTNDE